MLSISGGRAVEAVDQHLGHLGGQQVRFVLAELARGLAGAQNGRADFHGIEGRPAAVALDDFAGQYGCNSIHNQSPLYQHFVSDKEEPYDILWQSQDEFQVRIS